MDYLGPGSGTQVVLVIATTMKTTSTPGRTSRAAAASRPPAVTRMVRLVAVLAGMPETIMATRQAASGGAVRWGKRREAGTGRIHLISTRAKTNGAPAGRRTPLGP